MEPDRAQHLDAIEADLAGVELALARLEAGTYDTCEVCAGPLEGVVDVTPTARRCVTCAAGASASA